MAKTGIDWITYYTPGLYLDIEELAEKRGIEPAKLKKGLGLTAMALCDTDEDTVTMASEAVLKLIEQSGTDPRTIGRLYMGTESSLDSAKPTATYVASVVEKAVEGKYGERCFKNCDVLDMTFACVGAVDALHNCLEWVRGDASRKAIVIASDYAKYPLASTGEYTQGAGAVAMLVSHAPAFAPSAGISASVCREPGIFSNRSTRFPRWNSWKMRSGQQDILPKKRIRLWKNCLRTLSGDIRMQMYFCTATNLCSTAVVQRLLLCAYNRGIGTFFVHAAD